MRRLLAAMVGPVLLVAFVVSVAGCTPQTAYIEADRATFDALTPAYLQYVNGDAALDADQKERRGRLVDSWRIRLEKAEGGGS